MVSVPITNQKNSLRVKWTIWTSPILLVSIATHAVSGVFYSTDLALTVTAAARGVWLIVYCSVICQI